MSDINNSPPGFSYCDSNISAHMLFVNLITTVFEIALK